MWQSGAASAAWARWGSRRTAAAAARLASLCMAQPFPVRRAEGNLNRGNPLLAGRRRRILTRAQHLARPAVRTVAVGAVIEWIGIDAGAIEAAVGIAVG